MIVKKAFKFQLYPTPAQQQQLAIQFGHARFVYNHFRQLREETYQRTGQGLNYEATTKMLPALKQENPWLKEADSQVLQQSLKDLERAYQRWFDMCTGKIAKPVPKPGQKPRKDGKPAGYPRFKSRYGPQSIRYPQRFQVEGNKIYLPKAGWIEAIIHRPLEGQMKNCTVSKTNTGKYIVSIQVEVEIEEPIYEGDTIGLDLGLSSFAITSKGERIDNPRYWRKSEKKLKRLQRALSGKQKGSKAREQARQALALQHEKVANQRRDFLHQTSKRLVEQNQKIALEDLNVKGMMRNHHLAKSIADVGWAEFGRQLDYKGDWYGCHTPKVDRFYPSSKTCHVCGHINETLRLHHRTWVCESCQTLHNRDENAAINLEMAA